MANVQLLFVTFFGLYIARTNCFDESIVAEWPKSLALRLGQQGRLNCSMRSGADYTSMTWQVKTGTGTPKDIYNGSPTFGTLKDDKYEKVESKPHDLMVPTASWEHSGIYKCNVIDKSGESKAIEMFMTVTETIACTTGTTEKEEGMTVSLDCSIKYESPTYEGETFYLPNMKWFNSEGTELTDGYYVVKDPPPEGETPPSVDLPKDRLYRLNRTATGDDDGKKFTCKISFDNEFSTIYDTCETSYNVEFAVTELTFEPEYESVDTPPLNLKVGDHINCTARGNPTPKFVWTKQDLNAGGPQINEGTRLDIIEDMMGKTAEYECKASNTIKGQLKEAIRIVKFDVSLDTTGTGTRTALSLGVIVMALIISLFKLF